MTSSAATTKWLKYFDKAGIPSAAAANYAVIFTENRIQPDMLLDLNKEYLYDMGIRVMGDVIAILRYARTAYTEEAQKKILGEDTINPSISKTTRQTTPVPISSRVGMDFPAKKITKQIQSKPSAKIEKTKTSVARLIPTVSPSIKGKKVVSLKRSVRELDDDSLEALPVPKKVQKLTTKLTTVGLNSKNSTEVMKRSVFRRLGESSVSSSTDSVGLQGQSIFQRLGPSKTKTESQVATSTVDELIFGGKSSKGMSYKGISLTTGATLRGKHIVKPSSLSERISMSGLQVKKTITNRLGSKPMSSSTVSTTSEITYKPQRLLLQRSIADVASQNRKSKLFQDIARKDTGVKSRLSLKSTVPTRTLLNSSFRATSRITTSERIVKKPKVIAKPSIFSRLGPI